MHGAHLVEVGYDPKPIMGSGRGVPAPARFGWLAGIILPLVLLASTPADTWHEEHADGHECAVCHSKHQTADLARPPESASSQAPTRLEQPREVRRAVAWRFLHQRARAPPA